MGNSDAMLLNQYRMHFDCLIWVRLGACIDGFLSFVALALFIFLSKFSLLNSSIYTGSIFL